MMTTNERQIDELRDVVINLGVAAQKLVNIVHSLKTLLEGIENRVEKLEAERRVE